MTEQSPDPLPLERARLLLAWLRAQRAVDRCLSELLAAGPAGERRVSGAIERVADLVSATADAFAAYRESVQQSQGAADPAAERPVLAELRSVRLGTVSS